MDSATNSPEPLVIADRRPSMMQMMTGLIAMSVAGLDDNRRRPYVKSPYEGDLFSHTRQQPTQDNEVVEKIRADNAARRAANFAKQKKGHRK